MSTSRETALDILSGVFNNNSYSNILLGRELNKSDLQAKDKALVTEIIYGTIKYKYSLDKILCYFIKKNLKSLDTDVLNVLRLSIYQIRYLDKIPDFAAVNEAVNITKKRCGLSASKFVNAVLRNYLRNEKADFYDLNNEAEALSFNYSFEPWMVKHFINQYGRDTALNIMEGLNEVPSVTVRVNRLKGDYDYVFEKLKESGYKVEKGYICKEAIRIIGGKNIEENPLFKEGFITVQDESAMLVAASMELKNNLTVLDLCSAPGGKTTHISEIMNNTGTVKAYDLHKNKLNLIENNFKRLGVTNISCTEMDSSVYNESLSESADRVLIDVPCSGFGIIRKKPEIKYTKSIKSVQSIIKIQRKIMKNAAQYVKNNGFVIYSTCTLNKEENEQNINWFIKTNPNFKIEMINFGNFENLVYTKDGFVTILPNKNMDGFFICKLRKIR